MKKPYEKPTITAFAINDWYQQELDAIPTKIIIKQLSIYDLEVI